jgi:hypothetical protein
MAAFRQNLRSSTLNLIRAANDLLQEEKTILASIEECDYFRSIYRSSQGAPSPCRPPSVSPPDQMKQLEAPPSPSAKAIEPQMNAPLPASLPTKIDPVIEPTPAPSTSLAFHPDRGFAEIQKLLSKIAPEFTYVETVPSDAKAQQIAQRWKTKNQSAPISLLCLHELPLHQKFLTNLATALDVVFGPARLINAEGIEKEKQWETFLSVSELKLVIICDYALWQMPNLLQFYREVPNQTQRFLLNKPLMLLPDLTLYLKDPQLKRSLWKALCQKIGSL